MKFPKKIKVIEVGPRDGLQSLNKWIPTQNKIEMINLLSRANFPVIEVSSFAHPKVVPMLNDAEKVFERINRHDGIVYRALSPNFKGTFRAVETGMINETWFKAEKEGTYYGQCSELCGIKHAFMPITVKVVSEDDYQVWLSEARIKFAKEEIVNNKFKLASK